jgi:hypothetical protein
MKWWGDETQVHWVAMKENIGSKSGDKTKHKLEEWWQKRNTSLKNGDKMK